MSFIISSGSVDTLADTAMFTRHAAEIFDVELELHDELLPALGSHLDSGDVVLAKGSLSMKLGLVVDAIRKMGHPVLNDDRA